MANLRAQDFVNKIAADSNFRTQSGISEIKQLDEFQAKAAAAGFNFTSQELLAAVENQGTGALSDETLNNVSGGLKGVEIVKPIKITPAKSNLPEHR